MHQPISGFHAFVSKWNKKNSSWQLWQCLPSVVIYFTQSEMTGTSKTFNNNIQNFSASAIKWLPQTFCEAWKPNDALQRCGMWLTILTAMIPCHHLWAWSGVRRSTETETAQRQSVHCPAGRPPSVTPGQTWLWQWVTPVLVAVPRSLLRRTNPSADSPCTSDTDQSVTTLNQPPPYYNNSNQSHCHYCVLVSSIKVTSCQAQRWFDYIQVGQPPRYVTNRPSRPTQPSPLRWAKWILAVTKPHHQTQLTSTINWLTSCQAAQTLRQSWPSVQQTAAAVSASPSSSACTTLHEYESDTHKFHFTHNSWEPSDGENSRQRPLCQLWLLVHLVCPLTPTK